MFCTVHKWLISRSMDSHRPAPRWVARHEARCSTCRQFRHRCHDMARQLAEQALPVEPGVSRTLHARIIERCRESSQAGARVPTAHGHPRRLKVGVAMLAAAAVLLTVVGVWLALPERQLPPREDHFVLLLDPRGLTSESASLADDVLSGSIEQEVDALGKQGLAAADMVLALLPIDVFPPEDRRTRTR